MVSCGCRRARRRDAAARTAGAAAGVPHRTPVPQDRGRYKIETALAVKIQTEFRAVMYGSSAAELFARADQDSDGHFDAAEFSNCEYA